MSPSRTMRRALDDERGHQPLEASSDTYVPDIDTYDVPEQAVALATISICRSSPMKTNPRRSRPMTTSTASSPACSTA